MADEQIVEQRAAAPLGSPETLEYPDSDGQPMAESDEHYRAIQSIRAPLEVRYRDSADTYVSGDLLLYYERWNRHKRVAPDVLVTKGVGRGPRRTYLLWEEGKPPDFVAEVSSPGSRTNDRTVKRELYVRLGVQEYFLFDPVYEDSEHSGRLQGFRLWGDGSVEMGSGGAEGSGEELRSEVLGLSLRPEHKLIRLRDLATGEDLLRFDETEVARLASEESRRTAEQTRNDAAEARRLAETRVARLEALLEIGSPKANAKTHND